MKTERKVLGVLLAGGWSRRFGSDKASVILPSGQSLLKRSVDVFAEAELDVVVSVRANQILPQVQDNVCVDVVPNLGPLGGLLSVMQSYASEGYLVLPCDMPMMSAALLKKLVQCFANTSASAVLPRLDGNLFPMPLIVCQSVRADLQRYLATGNRDVHGFLNSLTHVATIEMDDDAKAFLNMNTPHDLTGMGIHERGLYDGINTVVDG